MQDKRPTIRICTFSRIMGAHREFYPSLVGILSPVFEELGVEVVSLTTALPDGSAGRRQEGLADVHYLEPRQTGRDFWIAAAAAFDRLHAEKPFDIVLGRGIATWGFFRYSRYATEVPVILHEGTYPRWLHRIETRTGALAPFLAWLLAPVFALKNRREQYCMRHAARIICITPALAVALRRISWWREHRAMALTYGFDTSRYHPKPPPADRPPRLVALGRMTWDKGILPMIDVLARLKNREAVLEALGPGSPRKFRAVLDHARRRGVAARYSAPGPVLHDQVPDRLAGAVAFIFPSTHAEGLGKVILEAMAAGLPVVAYRLPVLEGLVEDGVTGFLVPIRSVQAMADRVDQLLADPALAARMGAAARRKIETEFRPEVITEKWRALLDEVVAETSQRRGG
jgi:glycosyltransferase involved in cell wall biosynthesis